MISVINIADSASAEYCSTFHCLCVCLCVVTGVTSPLYDVLDHTNHTFSESSWSKDIKTDITKCLIHIHSKNWFRWFPETAEKLEFSAERLSVNAKTVNFSMCVRNKGQEEALLPFYS